MQTDHHIRAILFQLSPDERAVYEREPGASWVAGMAQRLSTMTVADGATWLRGEIGEIGAFTAARDQYATCDSPARQSSSYYS